jgi:Kef-type K+ transport system membrane component KefB
VSIRWKEPLGEYLCGFFVVAIGFPMQIGWVFQSLGWITGIELLQISAALGVLGGAYFARESKCSTSRKESTR